MLLQDPTWRSTRVILVGFPGFCWARFCWPHDTEPQHPRETECWPQCFKAAALLPYVLARSLTILEESEVVRSLRWRGE